MSPTYHDLPESNLPEVDLEAQFASRHSQRMRGTGTLVLVAVCAALVWMQVVPLALHALAAWHNPPQGPRAYLYSNVTFGTYVVNGKTIENRGILVVPVRQGRNTFELEAPPFHTQSCIASIPTSTSDTCQHIFANGGASSHPNTQDFGIAFPLDLNDLPSAEQLRVQATVARAITAAAASVRVTVPVGDYYATGFDAQHNIPIDRRATQPLIMTAQTAIADPHSPWQSDCPDGYCAVDPSSDDLLPKGIWAITKLYTLRWHFATFSGQGVATIPADLHIGEAQMRLLLAIDQVGNWHIIVGEPGESPTMQVSDTCHIGQQIAWAATNTGAQAGPQDVRHDAGIQGCAFTINAPEYIFGKPASFGQGLLIWRFGMLLTADDRAYSVYHALFPAALPDEIRAISG